MSAFSNPNDDRKDPVNRMIQKLLKLKNKALRGSQSVPKFTSHGNPIHFSSESENIELKKYANIRILENLISQLERIVI